MNVEIKGYSTISGDRITETINIFDIEDLFEDLDSSGYNSCTKIVYQTILINGKHLYVDKLKLALK